MRIPSLLALALAVATSARAQANDQRDAVAAIERLFTAMRSADSAVVRSAFAPIGRVVGLQAAGTAAPTVLPVDAFVQFAGRNAPGAWDERVIESAVHVDGPLATVWFSYDIVRNGTLAQCGHNSVQLQRGADRWLIQSMVFTAQTSGCAPRTSK